MMLIGEDQIVKRTKGNKQTMSAKMSRKNEALDSYGSYAPDQMVREAAPNNDKKEKSC